ncbi:TAXI family TRAP transporter solute-binding subunit [Thermodesulfobacteriota bacterium]
MRCQIKLVVTCLIVVSVIVGVVGAGALAQASEKREVVIDIWGGPFGGSIYTAAFALSDVLNKTHPWLKASMRSSKGSNDNILNSGKNPAKRATTLFLSGGSAANTAFLGTGAFKGRVTKGYKVIGVAVANWSFWMTTDPNIKRGKDLAGKRIGMWPRGSGGWTIGEKFGLQQIWGVYDKVKSIDYMSPADFMAALKDGLVDAVPFNTPVIPAKEKPTSVLSAAFAEVLSSGKPIYPITITKEEYETGAATARDKGDYPWQWAEVPAGMFKGAENWPAFGAAPYVNSFYCWEEAGEDVIYEVTKALIENTDKWSYYGAYTVSMVPEIIVGRIPHHAEGEIHPGALKYYKEKGLIPKYWKATEAKPRY